MQGGSLCRKRHVQQRDTEQKEACHVSGNRLLQGDVPAIEAFDFDAPGTHAKRLPTVSPEPVKEQKRDDEKEQVVSEILNGIAMIESDGDGRDDEEQRYQQEAIVKKCSASSKHHG